MSAEPDSYRGHDGVRRYFAGFDGMIEGVHYEAIELVQVGDHVLAEARMSGRGVSSGLDVGIDAFVVHELAGGRIVWMRPYPDRESATAALDSAG
jgi:ketosteroid isomerase-like protein